jgi:hypothetical protein
MCCIARAPPTASKEPAACRDPDVETEASELAPGDAKKEELVVFKAVAEVRKPTPTSTDSSAEVNAVPDIDVEVGFASIVEMYFAARC